MKSIIALVIVVVMVTGLTGCAEKLLSKVDTDIAVSMVNNNTIPDDCRTGFAAAIADISQDRDVQVTARVAAKFAPQPETTMYKHCYTIMSNLILLGKVAEDQFILGLQKAMSLGIVK